MKTCGAELCIPACDFCRFYNFNPGEGGVYTGEGWCCLHERPQDPGEMCEDFFCGAYKRKSGLVPPHV